MATPLFARSITLGRASRFHQLTSADALYDLLVLRIGSIVLGVEDLSRSITFWEQALGYVLREEPDDDWATLISPNAAGSQLSLMKSETPVQLHPRVHLDLYATDRDAEVTRLLELGANEVDWDLYPETPDFVVLEDPDKNRFCVIEKPEDWIGFR
jgi:catechol 2,3-dioxygenase-like lactoylglutathione lyase family enzyme